MSYSLSGYKIMRTRKQIPGMQQTKKMTKLALLWCTCALALTPAPRSPLPRRLGSSFSEDDLQRPAGHGYTRGPGEDDGFVDIPTVDLLLTQRNEAKRRRAALRLLSEVVPRS